MKWQNHLCFTIVSRSRGK